jgi:hypothetical protein
MTPNPPEPRKHFTVPLQPAVTDAVGYVIGDLRDPDPNADVTLLIVCAPCHGTATTEFGMTTLHETPVGPADRCQLCSGLLRGSTTAQTMA